MRGLAILFLLALFACKEDKPAIAELKKADGPVDRQVGTAAWAGARVGTKFYLNDAARTADGGAQLEVIGNALIAMQPRTVLRFGGTEKSSKIAVELGTIELTGTGSYGFDLGDVRLSRNGTVRITATPGGKAKVELAIGEAQVSRADGQTENLEVGKAIEIDIKVDSVQALPSDAGVDAPLPPPVDAAEPDAPPASPSDVATIETKGKKVEIMLAGAAKWTAVDAGAGDLPKGAKLRVGAGSEAKVTSMGTTLELGGGSRVSVDENLQLVIEVGDVQASATTDATVALPGGSHQLKGAPNAPAGAKLAVKDRGDAKVTQTRGSGKLTGAPGSELEMNRGESATLAKNGTLRVLEAIPSYFDFRVTAGETLTIHDPKPPTAVQFTFGDKCPNGGVVEMDKDNRFKTAKVSAGKESANLSVGTGSWAYRLRCTAGGTEGNAVASGRIGVKRDDGSRRLPTIPASNSIDADGRTWRLGYQSQIPNLVVNARASGSSFKLHLAIEGKEQTFDSKKPSVTVPGSQLKEGQYTYWFDVDGVKQAKTSTLIFNFDNTSAQVYIELPKNGKPWEGDIDVKGAVLAGWTASVDGNTIPLDGARRFQAKAQTPAGNALAIKLSHPKQGVHYYLRRAK